MRSYTTVILGSTGAFVPGSNANYFYSSQAFVGTGSPNQYVGSSAIGLTSVSGGIFTLGSTGALNGVGPIDRCNGFAVQLNVGLASSAVGYHPGGTVTLQGSCDGVNFSTMPTGYNGTTAITFATSGTFMMMNYPQPNFNYVRANYSAASSTAASIYSVLLTSKTFANI